MATKYYESRFGAESHRRNKKKDHVSYEPGKGWYITPYKTSIIEQMLRW